jgi:hypothetical protein
MPALNTANIKPIPRPRLAAAITIFVRWGNDRISAGIAISESGAPFAIVAAAAAASATRTRVVECSSRSLGVRGLPKKERSRWRKGDVFKLTGSR